MKYYYFVSYVCENSGQMGYGNLTFDMPKKIRTLKDTEPVIKEIEKTNAKKITILHIDLLDKE